MPATAATAATALRQDGFCRLGPVLDPAVVAALREAMARAVPDARPDGPYGVLRHDPWRADPAFADAARDLAPTVARLLATPAVVLFQDHIVWKPPGTDDPVLWHQDVSYWPLDAPVGVTVWVALDDSDDDNGALRYVRGTHRLGPRRAADFVPGASRDGDDGLLPIDVEGRDGDIVSVPVAAGEALAHDPLVWHMSPPNRTARHRRAWSSSWVTPAARWAPDAAPHPYLHDLRPRPGAPLDPGRFPLIEVT